MSYAEHAPPPALLPWVQCTWEQRSALDLTVRVVPDGCMDVVWIEGTGTMLVGANTTAFLVPLAAGTRAVGVRLRTGAAPSLLGVDGPTFRDARAPLHEVWGDRGRRLAATLDAGTDPEAALVNALAARARGCRAPDPLVLAAVARLGAPASIREVARDLHVSERQLHRRVADAVGYGPKRLARVLRLGRALDAARAGEAWGRVAADAGYADQAHLTSDCHALAGLSPSRMLAA